MEKKKGKANMLERRRKLLFKSLKKIVGETNIIPDHQLGFRNIHSTIEKVHIISNVIEETLEELNQL